ncbi:MAG: glutamate-5-semialdehyde dehydrogenase [Termitinemataceae bacterium]|nr:MAG: glutamate-5-semialdehyde dehydrogenase [Termitinemataceae bacterium]
MALEEIFEQLNRAKAVLALESGAQKDKALYLCAEEILKNSAKIQACNDIDVKNAHNGGVKEALIDRLALNQERIADIANGIREIARLPDPCGRVIDGWTRPNGLFIEKITVPLGVVAIIYESRPNVTADAFALAYKAGCPILLRGSSQALASNKAIAAVIKAALEGCGGVADAIALADSGSRNEVDEILNARGKIDVVLPRGGHSLIRRVVENARVPVIQTGEGNCHIYVEPSAVGSEADIETVCGIIFNAKTQKPGACNAVETLLVHEDAATRLMPKLAEKLNGHCELRCDPISLAAIGNIHQGLSVKKASEDDWGREFLDYILAVRTVGGIDEAINHINKWGTGHSEAILSQNLQSAERFTREIDAACVYVNASTRFTDGCQFGFGAELGISTQKFHARGPMGLDALTTIKYRINGNGQIR